MDFGIKLQTLRKEKGLSQEALADQLDVSRQAVSKWETGEGYPEMNTLLLISDLFQVSLDYLLKDEKTETIPQDKYFMSHQRIEEYIHFKKQFAYRIAGAVAAIIVSVDFPIYLDTRNAGLAVFVMLMIIALAVGCIVLTGMSHQKYEDLENKEIYMSYQDSQDLQIQYTQFKSRFGMGIAFGVCLIIMSLACVILLEEYYHESLWAPMQLMICVAIAVFLFIDLGIQDHMYHFLVRNQDYIHQKRKQKENDDIYAMTMPLAAMVYLLMGFLKDWWHPGWIIFPITAILSQIFVMITKKRD